MKQRERARSRVVEGGCKRTLILAWRLCQRKRGESKGAMEILCIKAPRCIEREEWTLAYLIKSPWL